MKNFVVIPAYNEGKHLQKVLQKTKQYIENIVVVDDGSADNTYEIAKASGIYALKHTINLGKGSALKLGCDYAVSQGAENIVVMDADTQHDPSMINKFLQELKDHDVVFGYRELAKSMPFILRFGNKFINNTVKLLYGLQLKDTQCGYRAFTARAYRAIRWKATDYSMESEMIAKVGEKKLSYSEIPIKTIYADKYKGTTVIDGIKIVLKMFSWRLFQ